MSKADRISAGQFDRASAHRRSADEDSAGRCVLEDVHDRHPGGRNPRALLLYLGRIVELHRTFPEGESGDRTWINHPISLTLIAFVCTSVPALLLHKWSEKNLGSLTVMALALLHGRHHHVGRRRWTARYEPSTSHVEEMSLGQAIWIGLCQTLSAIFPGTSRSMSTIAAGQIVGPRPAIGARIQLSALDSDHDRRHRLGPAQGDPPRQVGRCRRCAAAHVVMNSERWIVLIIGFVVSFIVALGVVEWFLMWVRKHGLPSSPSTASSGGIVLLLVGEPSSSA